MFQCVLINNEFYYNDLARQALDHASSIMNIEKADIFKFDLLVRYLGLAKSFNISNITFNLKSFNYLIFLEF